MADKTTTNNIFHPDNLKETMTALLKRYDEIDIILGDCDYDRSHDGIVLLEKERKMIRGTLHSFAYNTGGLTVRTYYNLPERD